MTKLLVLALCVCLVMSMSVKERLEKSEALNEIEESQEGCNYSLIDNGECNYECDKKMYGYDGGDCCSWLWKGDGICNDFCNFEKLNWDDGDCPH